MDDARGEDIGAQAAALHQTGQDARLGEVLQMLAGVTQAHAAGGDPADAEGAAHQGVKADALGDQVAAGLADLEEDAGIGSQAVDGFALDQGEVATAAGMIGIEALLLEVAVAHEAAAGDGLG